MPGLSVTKILPPETPPTVLTAFAWIEPPPLVLTLLLLGESASTSQPFAVTFVPPLKVTSTILASGDRPRMQVGNVGPGFLKTKAATARPLTVGAVAPVIALARYTFCGAVTMTSYALALPA